MSTSSGPGRPAPTRSVAQLSISAGRLEELGREAETETFAVWPAWATGYAINCGVAVIGSVVAVSSATLGTGLVLLATIPTFLDLAGILPTTRRLLGRRASQNVVSWGDRDRDGAVILVAHYDTGPLRTRPLRPMFLAMLVLLACCVLRAGGMEGTALTVVQFIPTVALIVYVALLLDVVPLPRGPRRERQRLRRGASSSASRSASTSLDYFGVHVLFTGSQKAMAQGCAVPEGAPQGAAAGDTVVLNLDAVGGGEVRDDEEGGAAPHRGLAPEAERRTGRPRRSRTASRATATPPPRPAWPP